MKPQHVGRGLAPAAFRGGGTPRRPLPRGAASFRHLPTPSTPTPRRRRTSADGVSFADPGRNGRRKRGTAARSCAPAASANVRVLAPINGGGLGGGGAYGSPPGAQRRRRSHPARAPLSASLPTFSARRKYLALRRNRRRSFRNIPPDAGRDHGTPFGGHRGRSPLYRNWVVGGFRKFSPSGETAAGLSATDHPMCCIFPYIQGGDKDKEKDKEKDYDHEKEKDARPGGPGTGGPAAAGRHYRDRRSEIGDKGARIPTLHASLFPFHSSLVVGVTGLEAPSGRKNKIGG